MVKTTVRLAQQRMSDPEKLFDWLEQVTDRSGILGGEIYRLDGTRIASFGEKPQLRFSDLKNIRSWDCDRLWLGDRYDVAWSGYPFDVNYISIVRHNSSSVQSALYAYAARLAGWVLIISVVVTASTMLVLGKVAIAPILKLRDELMLAADALSRKTPELPDFYSVQVKHQDELGDVMQTFCQMFDRVY